MARGPEGKFKTAVDEKLPLDIHHQAMSGMFNNGTPDRYYEQKRHLWVEYKWHEARKPKKPVVPFEQLEPLQRVWCKRAAHNKQPVVIVVAGPGWVVVANRKNWYLGHEPIEGNAAMVALMIEDHCRGRTELHE